MNPSAGSAPDCSARVAAPGFGRSIWNSAIFLAVFACACMLIRSMLPFPEIPGVYQKWLYFTKNKDAYDVLLLGSSRFYHQIIPQQFDAAVKAQAGKELRTFNFGYDGMWPPESFWMLRKILATKPARLRWVFIDCMDINPMLTEEIADTKRTAAWHDLEHTLMACESVLDATYVPRMKWRYLTGHGSLLLRQWTNQGCATEWLGYEFGLEKRKKASRWNPPKGWKDTEGYEREKEYTFEGEHRERFVRRVAEVKESFPPQEMKASFRRAVAKIASDVRAAGAEPIFVITPTVDRREHFVGFPPDITVWRYHDPHAHPALYEAENHFDVAHLNYSGARIFTDLLATRFAEVLKNQP